MKIASLTAVLQDRKGINYFIPDLGRTYHDVRTYNQCDQYLNDQKSLHLRFLGGLVNQTMERRELRVLDVKLPTF